MGNGGATPTNLPIIGPPQQTSGSTSIPFSVSILPTPSTTIFASSSVVRPVAMSTFTTPISQASTMTIPASSAVTPTTVIETSIPIIDQTISETTFSIFSTISSTIIDQTTSMLTFISQSISTVSSTILGTTPTIAVTTSSIITMPAMPTTQPILDITTFLNMIPEPSYYSPSLDLFGMFLNSSYSDMILIIPFEQLTTASLFTNSLLPRSEVLNTCFAPSSSQYCSCGTTVSSSTELNLTMLTYSQAYNSVCNSSILSERITTAVSELNDNNSACEVLIKIIIDNPSRYTALTNAGGKLNSTCGPRLRSLTAPVVSFTPNTLSILGTEGIAVNINCTSISEINATYIQLYGGTLQTNNSNNIQLSMIFPVGSYTISCTATNVVGNSTIYLMITINAASESITMLENILNNGTLTSAEIETVVMGLASISLSLLNQTAGVISSDTLLSSELLFSFSTLVANAAISQSTTDNFFVAANNLITTVNQVQNISGMSSIIGDLSNVLTSTAEAVNLFGSAIARNLPIGEIIFLTGDTIIFNAISIDSSNLIDNVNIPLGNQQITIPPIILQDIGDPNARISAAFIQTNSALNTSTTPATEFDLASGILTLSIDGIPEGTFLNMTISFLFEVPLLTSSSDIEARCVFFNTTTQSYEDVITGPSNTTTNEIICITDHLTSFGVFARSSRITPNPIETLAISIVTYILLSISLIFLIISLILFILPLKKFFSVDINKLYFNWALSITFAIIVYIFGIQLGLSSIAACSVVTFLLHYLWLSVFSNSVSIGLFFIYLLWIAPLRTLYVWWIFIIIGWTIPIPIVIITVIVGSVGGFYVDLIDHCFLSYTNGLIWSFLAPLILFIVINIIVLTTVGIKIFVVFRRNELSLKTNVKAIRSALISVAILLPILSVPWVIAFVNIFTTNLYSTIIVEWIFVIFNAPSGIFFFLFITIRNKQVLDFILRRNDDVNKSNEYSTAITTAKQKFTKPKSKTELEDTVISQGNVYEENVMYSEAANVPSPRKKRTPSSTSATPRKITRSKSKSSNAPSKTSDISLILDNEHKSIDDKIDEIIEN